jgi:hypothetical protein
LEVNPLAAANPERDPQVCRSGASMDEAHPTPPEGRKKKSIIDDNAIKKKKRKMRAVPGQ